MDYKSADYFIYEQLVQFENAVHPLRLDKEILSEIKKQKEKIVNKSYRVAVVGEFKRGKSSLINALLGSEILPADITPTTATVNRITYGIKPKITVNYKDGHNENIGMTELSEYVTKLTREGEARARTINETIIEYPTSICRNYVDIIDTPGLNDNEEMTAVTLALLKNIDAAIVAISAKSPFSGLEKSYICDMIMNNDIYDMVFAVTFIDAFTDDETRRLIDYISKGLQKDVFVELKNRKAGFSTIKKAHRILDEPKICGVSSYYALESDKTRDAQMRQKSGIDAFTQMINLAFNSGQSQSIRDGAIDFIETSAERIDELHLERITASENDNASADELSRLFEDFEQKYDSLIGKSFEKTVNYTKIKAKEMYALKNEAARFFVNEISSQVYENTNEEIRNIVNAAYDKQEENINEWIENNLKSYVLALLNNESGAVVRNYKRSFASELKKLTVEARPAKKALTTILAAKLSDAAQRKGNDSSVAICESTKIIEGCRFAFCKKEFLESDLTDRNIIDDILDSIDISFTQFTDQFIASILDTEKLWCEKASTHSQHLCHLARTAADDKTFATDIAKADYIEKYETYSSKTKKIINNVRSIKE